MQNEDSIGQAIQKKIAEGVVTRDQLFLTSKLWSTFHSKDKVHEGVKASLEVGSQGSSMVINQDIVHGKQPKLKERKKEKKERKKERK